MNSTIHAGKAPKIGSCSPTGIKLVVPVPLHKTLQMTLQYRYRQ